MGRPYSALLDDNLTESTVQALAGGALTINLPFDPSYRHSFAGVEFYSDADGDTPVAASAGTITYTLTLPVMPNDQQSFTNNVSNAVNADTVNWAANVLSVRATIAGITGSPTHARLRVSGNIS